MQRSAAGDIPVAQQHRAAVTDLLIGVLIQNCLIVLRVGGRKLEPIREGKRIDQRLRGAGNNDYRAVAAIVVFNGDVADQAEGQIRGRLIQQLHLEGARTMRVVVVIGIGVFYVPVIIADQGCYAHRHLVRNRNVARDPCQHVAIVAYGHFIGTIVVGELRLGAGQHQCAGGRVLAEQCSLRPLQNLQIVVIQKIGKQLAGTAQIYPIDEYTDVALEGPITACAAETANLNVRDGLRVGAGLEANTRRHRPEIRDIVDVPGGKFIAGNDRDRDRGLLQTLRAPLRRDDDFSERLDLTGSICLLRPHHVRPNTDSQKCCNVPQQRQFFYPVHVLVTIPLCSYRRRGDRDHSALGQAAGQSGVLEKYLQGLMQRVSTRNGVGLECLDDVVGKKKLRFSLPRQRLQRDVHVERGYVNFIPLLRSVYAHHE